MGSCSDVSCNMCAIPSSSCDSPRTVPKRCCTHSCGRRRSSPFGGRPRPTTDTYQARYAAAIGAPTSLLEVLALTQVFERGVYRHFVMHLHRRGTHPRVQATLRRMLADERGHLSWVKEWLDRRTGAQRAAVPVLMRRYSAVDAEIRKQLLSDYEWPELACAS